MEYYQRCIGRIKYLIEEGKKEYSYIRRTKNLILLSIKAPHAYLTPYKGKHLKEKTFEILYRKLASLTIHKIYKSLKKF